MLRISAALATALALSGTAVAEESLAAKAYDPNMAKAFAALSTAAYCANEFPRGIPAGLTKAVEANCGAGEGSWCAPAGFAVVRGTVNFVNLPDLGALDQIFAIVAGWERLPYASPLSVPEEKGCLVVFRGSIGDISTGPNWIRDKQSDNVPTHTWPECLNCKVHKGYYAMWRTLEEKLLKKLRRAGCSAEAKSAVYVSGHSLGGSMTYFGMYGLGRLGFKVQVSYSFAAPAVGNSYFTVAFVSLFNRDIPLFHLNHADDDTGTFPEGSLHPPFQVYYPDDTDNYTVCDPAAADCGIFRYDPDTLTGADDAPPMRSPHCRFPLAPFGSFCQFMGMPAINLFFLGPVGMLDFQEVCVRGGLMSAKHAKLAKGIFV